MIFNINNNIYLEVGDFVKLGVKPSLIKKWTNYHNQKRNNGKNSDYWVSIAHPDHGKKILVRYNSLPEKFQIKYSLPTEEEIKQDQAVNKFEEVEAKKTSEIQIIQQALNECLSKKYLEYYPEYLLKFAGDKKKAANYARNHSIFSYLIDLFSSADQATLKIAFEQYIKLDLPSKCFNFISFKRKLIKLEAEGVENCLINKLNGKESNRKITSNFHIAIVEKLYADPHKYKHNQIYKSLTAACCEHQKPVPSFSWVKKHLSANEVKNRLCEFRYGIKQYNDTVSAYMPRQKALHAGDLYMMDGTPLQFQCFDNNGRLIRLNLYVVLDVYSGKITGFDLSLSEDRHAVINSLQFSFNLHDHLPYEILHDNFSAVKTDEFKALSKKLEMLGVHFRAARVGNPADKANVERFFSTFQSRYCSLLDGYIGEGITSKRKDARANPEFLKKYIDKGLPNIDEMKVRIIQLINMYNVCKTQQEASCSELYQTSLKPNVKQIDKTQLSFLFWKEKEIKVSRSMVKVIVQKQDFTFEIYDNDLKNNLNGKKVRCRYDENDMSVIHLFDLETDMFLCECKANYKAHQAQANQTEEDKKAILVYDAKKKSHRLHNHRLTEEIQKAGALETDNNEIFIEQPYSVYKNEANSSEFSELNKLIAIQSNIDFSKVREYKPIEQELVYVNANKNSIKHTLNNKVFEKSPSLKTFNPKEENEEE